MKEQYSEDKMDIIVLDCEDIVATSSACFDAGPTLSNDDWV